MKVHQDLRCLTSTVVCCMMATVSILTPITKSEAVTEASVKDTADDSLCYNSADKGFTYRGTVNYTNDYRECINWSDAVHCPHNFYRFADMSAGLDGNYCRNPGDGSMPWCYVSTGCEKEYCDVCHVDTPNDKASPEICESTKCSTFHEKLQCAKKCQNELLQPQPSASTITCAKQPSMSWGSRVVNLDDKVNFAVGESVTFECRKCRKHQRTTLKKYCLSTGEWSEETTACLPCYKEKGYVLFGEFCYKIESERKTAEEHQKECRSLNGNLADVKTLEEQKFITELGIKHGASSLYIGADDIEKEGTFRFRDNSIVQWAPWHSSNSNDHTKNCVISSNNTWCASECNERKMAVCKTKKIVQTHRTSGSQCSDSREDCADLLLKDPEMCQRDHESFGFTQCTRTCKKCHYFWYTVA